MRYYYFLILGIILISCSKDNEELSIEKKIIGKWSWIETNGGFIANSHYTPENTGEKRELIFNKNKIVYITLNSDTIHITNYFTSRETSVLYGEEFDFLTINYRYQLPDTVIYLPMRYIIQKLDNELELFEDVYEPFTIRYRRIKN